MRFATVDALVFKENNILLVKRGKDPFKGKWALPGGFIDEEETAEQACRREVKEETSLEVQVKRLHGVFSSPSRDPRNCISIVFVCELEGGELRKGDDASEAAWHSLDLLPQLAFDHEKILADARKKRVSNP